MAFGIYSFFLNIPTTPRIVVLIICLVIFIFGVYSVIQEQKEKKGEAQEREYQTQLLEEHKLRDLGLEDNTLVIFSSDNGPHKEGGADPEFNDSSGPLKGKKRDLYEGGIRVPMVWSYPDGLPQGTVENRVILSLDIAATSLDLAGIPAVESSDGRSLLSWATNPLSQSPHEVVYWRMPGGKLALRSGNWKIVRPTRNAPIELYHLAGDLGETRNLVSQHPDKMKDLINIWNSIDDEMAEPIELGT